MFKKDLESIRREISNLDRSQFFSDYLYFLRLLFEDEKTVSYISTYLIPDHIGVLIRAYSIDELKIELQDLKFNIKDQFSSSVVADTIKTKYSLEQVRIEILKVKSEMGHLLEIFVPDTCINPKIIQKERKNIFHYALSPKTDISKLELKEILTIFFNSGFSFLDGGVNLTEESTVFYFQKEGYKIELFLRGVQRDFLKSVTESNLKHKLVFNN